LGGDRAAVLTLKAAAQGVIDFTKTDLHDPSWWKSWRYLTKTLDEADRSTLLRLSFDLQLALVSNSLVGADGFAAIQKHAKEIFYDIEGTIRPWLGRTKEERDIHEREQFQEAWQQQFGWSLSDVDARLAWEESLEQNMESASREREAEAKQAAESDFNKKVEAIRLKRLKQQGRL
jgi:hypothetical protein